MSDDSTFLHDGPSLVIESILKQKAVDKYKIQVTRAVPKGENYLGIVFRVTATAEKNNEVFNLIVKMAMGEDVPRTEIPLELMYSRETLMYTELLPLYEQLQVEAGIPKEDQFKFTRQYKISNEKFKEYLIFDDLKAAGYSLMNRKVDIDYKHAQVTLEALGKFHAMSFVLKSRQPDKFKYFSDNLTELIFTGSDWNNSFADIAFGKACAVAKDEKHKKILQHYQKNVVQRMIELLKCDEYSVLAHNDCWINNMMFRYENNEPVEVRLLDYQISRFGPPEADLLLFIFTSTGQQVRRAHYEDMLLSYYNAMKNHLEVYNLDIRDIYPWTKFKSELKRKSMIALHMGIGYAIITTTEADVAPNIGDFADMSKAELFKTEPPDSYKQRVNEVLEDLTSLGYFDNLNL